MEIESKFSPEERAKIQKERTLSDAELIKGGAEYRSDEKGKLELEPTANSKEAIRLEKEGGVYDDLANYIRFNKVIILPNEEIGEKTREAVAANKGAIWSEDKSIYWYIDKDGNIAQFKVDPEKIKSLKGAIIEGGSMGEGSYMTLGNGKLLSYGKLSELMNQELIKNGFKSLAYGSQLSLQISSEARNYRRRIMKEEGERKEKEFNF